LGNELKVRLEADCKNNLNWAAAFKLSRRGLRAELETMKPCELSFEMTSSENHQSAKHSLLPHIFDPGASPPSNKDNIEHLLGSSKQYPKTDSRHPHDLGDLFNVTCPGKLKSGNFSVDYIDEDNATNYGTVTSGSIFQESAEFPSGSNPTSFPKSFQSYGTFNESHKRNFESFQQDYGFLDGPVSQNFLDMNSTPFDDALQPLHPAGHHFGTYVDSLNSNAEYVLPDTYQDEDYFADIFQDKDLYPGPIDTHDPLYVKSRLLHPEP
jgi:hypothetical protein